MSHAIIAAFVCGLPVGMWLQYMLAPRIKR